MNLLKTSILPAILFLTGSFVNSALAQTDTDSAAILHQAERWLEAAREENVDALITIYTDDAVMLPPGD